MDGPGLKPQLLEWIEMKIRRTFTHKCSLLVLLELFVSLFFLGSRPVQAQTSGPTPYPDPKNDAAWPGKGPIRYFEGWMPGDRKRFWSARETDQGKIVFVGDSIIGGWKVEKDFPGKPVANRGVGGDVTRGLLFRFQEDVLDLHPKAIVIEIGSNDITADASVANVILNYNALLDLAQKANPETPIIIMALTPHGVPTGAKAPNAQLAAYLQKVNARIPLMNRELEKIPAARKNVTYVDTYSPFMLPNGNLDDSQFNDDKVHPTDAGHAKLAEIVGKALKELNLL
jgi:lysophospholipase L1-like esterase